VAWFTIDPISTADGIILSNANQTMTSDNYENKVALSNIGFSRGVHYWEITIDRYDGSADPAFGVAYRDVCRSKMLGMIRKQSF
jgi:PREDICTED: tripartite motif-containing 9-like